ncbi:hypothetical protein NX059_005426 [Plenodomus lindquistii]|nr:hypothetical protein NX059_005426 [Plenodomus lindquistii]
MNVSKVSRWGPFRRPILATMTEETAAPPLPRSNAKSKTWQTTVTSVKSWPEEARVLKKRTWLSYVYGIGDVLLVLLPVYFILLGIAAASLNGKPTKDNTLGPKVESAMDIVS